MPKFLITYTDPDTQEEREEIGFFEDWMGRAGDEKGDESGPVLAISAEEWAEDLAYSLADKGGYRVEKIGD